jgi:20S proteasome alpha/beta subunit
MYTIKKEREIAALTFAYLVSSTLYELRFGLYFIEPVVAGLEPIPMPGAAKVVTTSAAEGGEGEGAASGEKAKRRYKPLIASTNLIGCINWAKVRHCAPIACHEPPLYRMN